MGCITNDQGAATPFIGKCPTIELSMGGVRMTALLDTGSQVTLVQQQVMDSYFPQMKSDKSLVFTLKAANGLTIPYSGYAIMDFEVEGLKIPEKGVVIVKDDCSTHPLIVGMNVIGACWDTVFKGGTSALSPQKWKSHQAWEEAFAVCQRISATRMEGDSLGCVRPACRQGIQVPPNCEIMIWGRASQKMRSRNGPVLVEAIRGSGQWGAARTLSVVDRGRLPVRVCNPHPYPLQIGPYEKLGRLYQVEETEIQGAGDLSLTMGLDGVVEVGVTKAVEMEESNSCEEVNKLLTSVVLPPEQKVELQAFLQRWKKVFSVDEEDVGRTDLVQHSIHTGNVAPIKQRYRPLPPLMYKEMKTLLADMLNKRVIRESKSPWAAPIVLD
ncbi:uncharacterized protein LOC118558123 [Fundulus heteroclitus]|uniref:uncharacterized protein LOC118558123 n=1 Tax=Fundulus heteroclitus TaxID=8078 RepID=UPI00165C87F7|nr:uncharacterized protein LOC118558123 [Fundulus heteroclitus]